MSSQASRHTNAELKSLNPPIVNSKNNKPLQNNQSMTISDVSEVKDVHVSEHGAATATNGGLFLTHSPSIVPGSQPSSDILLFRTTVTEHRTETNDSGKITTVPFEGILLGVSILLYCMRSLIHELFFFQFLQNINTV